MNAFTYHSVNWAPQNIYAIIPNIIKGPRGIYDDRWTFLIIINSIIKTEAQLCYYIYCKFGEGRYMVLAHQRGYKPFWKFWIGFIKSNGFIRDLNKAKEGETKTFMRIGPTYLIKSRPGIMHPYQDFK